MLLLYTILIYYIYIIHPSAILTYLYYYRKESGLPFFEVILLPNLPKSAGLPVGLTQQTKLRLQDGRCV